MPIYATSTAKDYWLKLKAENRSRSLAASRFVSLKTNATGQEDKSWRKESCEAIAKGATHAGKADSMARFVTSLVNQGCALLHAKLEARLILDAAGGVMENGGICLDRTSGIPFIPGSAVKGCARRCAIHLLGDEQDLDAKATLLAQIAMVFGYGDQEWKPGRKDKKEGTHDFARSDFWLAMVPLFDTGREFDDKRNELWNTVSEQAADLIFEYLLRAPKDKEKPHAPQLPNLSGNVCFLPAYPEKDHGIEIDVLTPHHPKYYSQEKDRAGKLVKPIATDDEDPNPVLFPTIAPGSIFRFPLAPIHQGAWASCPRVFASSDPLAQVKSWLAQGLELFGLGAKTNAGYGWFGIDVSADQKTSKLLQAQKEAEELKNLQPCPEIAKILQERLEKNQLAGNLNQYSYDPGLWPQESTNLYQMTLFHFVREHSPQLAQSKKGAKSMENLAKKLNIQYP